MYKILFFIHKPIDEKILKHFRTRTLKLLSELTGKEILLAEVESNLLIDQKFSYYCEVQFESKDEMDNKMNSKSGLTLSKDLMDFHHLITVINVNYNI